MCFLRLLSYFYFFFNFCFFLLFGCVDTTQHIKKQIKIKNTHTLLLPHNFTKKTKTKTKKRKMQTQKK